MDSVFDRAFRRVIGWRVRLDIGDQIFDAFMLFAVDVRGHEPPIVHEHRRKSGILIESLLLRHCFLTLLISYGGNERAPSLAVRLQSPYCAASSPIGTASLSDG